jgi:hypothetical protein
MYINPKDVPIQDGVPFQPNGQQMKRDAMVGENNIYEVQRFMARLGWTRFAPDVREDPNSLWNLACMHLALRLFRAIAMEGAYAFMGLEDDCVGKHNAQHLYYINYVHSRLRGQYFKEIRQPGKVESAKDLETIRARKNRVCSRT